MTLGEIWAVIWARQRNKEPDEREQMYQELQELKGK